MANLPYTSKEAQAEATPESILATMMDGNERFQKGEPSERDVNASRAEAVNGQYPLAYVLSCVDSRVPVEQVFDVGIGDVFVGRVAGNIDTTEQLGSMEFATKVAGSKVIMVLGHESCGAVKGACDGVKLGNLTALLNGIDPAVKASMPDLAEDQRTSRNTEFVEAVTVQNVKQTVKDILENSEVIKEMVDAGDVKVVGAYYSLQDGSVSLVE